MQKIAITGADGFTGRYLVDLLTKQGHSVFGLIHGDPSGRDLGVECHECDLMDMGSISRALHAVRPDKVVHLAAVSFVAHDDVETIYQTNVIGTRNLLEATTEASLALDAFLMASSANVYGNQISDIITEQTLPAPANDYAVSKIAMEYVGRLYADRIPIITVRPFNYTGVGQRPNFLIPKIVDHIRRKEPLIELGNLDVARDFSDVRSVVAAYAALLEEPSAIGEVYNICSGRAYSLHEILEMAQEISGHSIEVSVNPAFVRNNEVKTLTGSRARIDALFPALPNPPLEETIRWMLDS